MSDFEIPDEIAEKMKRGESLLPEGTPMELPEDIAPEIKEAIERAGIEYKGQKGWTSLIQKGAMPPNIEKILMPRNPENKDVPSETKLPADEGLQAKPKYKTASRTEDSEANYTGKNVPEVKPSPLSEREPLELPIKDGDDDLFYFSILDDQPYQEEISFFNSRFRIGLRTRTLREVDLIIAKVSKDAPDINIQVDMAFSKYHLCYAVSYIKMLTMGGVTEDKRLDSGTLEERYAKIEDMSSHKYLLLSDAMAAFDKKVEKLQERAKHPNF